MRDRGLAFIEVVIAVAIIAVILAIAIPNLRRASIEDNEATAILSLRKISRAEEAFREAVIIDNDTDGVGEYGLLLTMANLPGKEIPTWVDPPFIDEQLGSGNKSGYTFAIGRGPTGCPPASTTPNASEVTYFAVAWPIKYGSTGNRSFCLNISGVIRGSDIPNGVGPTCGAVTGAMPWPLVGG